ncbi:hypothetical protein KAR91_40630 [Candidatus Pacearchaeota archaeon]|nr:hypothetical protein [Candidatus Pacearchaeota archaeon]
MNSTWIKSYRKIKDWRYYKVDGYVLLWMHLLLSAHHDEKSIYDGYGNEIKKGQFSTGRNKLSRETGLTASKVERTLSVLEREGQIGQQKNNKCRIITITNWEIYQSVNIKRTSNEHQANIKRTQNKNEKNEKNEKNIYINHFEELYKKYPRKVGKARGIEMCQKKIRSKKDFEDFTKAVENYKKHCIVKEKETNFILHFSTFVNTRWLDWVEPDPSELTANRIVNGVYMGEPMVEPRD